MDPTVRNATYGLGIDTGGTYTDAAIVDMATRKVVAKAKSPTTYYDLTIGLGGAVDNVLAATQVRAEEIAMVGVSTTLATNSILEDKGGKVGLICIGWHPDREWPTGATKEACISGGHDVHGKEQSRLDAREVEDAINAVSPGSDSLVVSSIFSVYNPEHEEAVRKAIARLSGLPVVAGHELTGELGIRERTNTAVLNARLLPIIAQFLSDVHDALVGRAVLAPIMVFRGDGTLMNLETARKRPVDTILSGPAASAVGGRVLAGLDDCIVVDIGGTSTDIAFLKEGFPRVSEMGASVGQWRTRVQAVDVWTCALGGDSEILATTAGEVRISSDRVVPLCLAVQRHPSLLRKIVETQEVHFYEAYPREVDGLPKAEQEVLDFLRQNGASSMGELRAALPELYLIDSYLRSLRNRNLVAGIGPTPTDVLHAEGVYLQGDAEASARGLEVVALSLGRTREQVDKLVLKMISDRIAREVVNKLLMDEVSTVPEGTAGNYLVDIATRARAPRSLRLGTTLDRPLVGIGAPAHIFLPPLAERLGTGVIVPEDHDVGNAVGAVCSQVSVSAEVSVFPRNFKFMLCTPYGSPVEYEHLDDAIAKGRELVTKHVEEEASRSGASKARVIVDVIERRTTAGYLVAGDIITQVDIKARAVGNPTIVDKN
jgi:N-methylhydantoinase A/oxoprolinase/acetone carboxylase beta subunit